MANAGNAEAVVGTARYRWWILAAATSAQAAAAVSVQGVGVLGGFIQQDLHLSNADVGVLAGVLDAAPLLGLLLAGEWLDRAGERPVVAAGAFIMGAAMTMAGLAARFPELLICLFLVGVGYSTAQPSGAKAVFHWFSLRERGFAMGVRQAGLPLGGVVAAAIFPGVVSAWGWRTAFQIGAWIVIGGAAFFCIAYRRPPRGNPDKGGHGGGHTLPPRKTIAHARTLLAMAEFRLAALAGLTLITIQIVASMFLALYVRDRFGLPLAVGAQHLLVLQLAGVAGRILLAAWSDHAHHGRAAIVFVTAVGALLGWSALGLFPERWSNDLLFLGSAWLGFFGFGWYGPWVAWISELSPEGRLGATLGIAMAINQVSIVGAPIVFGFMIDASGGYVVPGAALAGAMTIYLAYGARRMFGVAAQGREK